MHRFCKHVKNKLNIDINCHSHCVNTITYYSHSRLRKSINVRNMELCEYR